MSSYYQMDLRITDPSPYRVMAIQEAAEDLWPFSDWNDTQAVPIPSVEKRQLMASGRSDLCHAATEVEFATRLAHAIWEANGEYCEVRVDATYLADAPVSKIVRGEDDYDEFLKQQESNA